MLPPLLPAIAEGIADTLVFCAGSIYPEPSGGIHSDLIPEVWKWVKGHGVVKVGQKVLDIGPGTGMAMDLFTNDGLKAVGMSASPEECKLIDGCLPMDMHEIWAFESFFSGVWARHSLEHSPMPLMMLRGIHRALQPQGWLYLEFPGIGTACKHDSLNRNHFSVLSKDMWTKLILDAGFKIIDSASITFTVEAGDDEYYSFLAIRA